jgi:tRNA-intron endonuclease
MTPTAHLVEKDRLVVWDVEEGNNLYSDGFYGKPLGIPKPREKFDTPLILDAIEGLYLAEEGRLRINDDRGRRIPPKKLAAMFRDKVHGFEAKYSVYRHLRSRGLVVTPGIKYGCDFAVYKHGPGVDHAPYIVQVWFSGDLIGAEEMVKAGRLATTVRKSFIIALTLDEPAYLEFDWWKA